MIIIYIQMGGSKKMQQVRSIANRPQGGGNKKQGLPPSIGRPGWLSNFIRSSAGGYFRGIPAGGGPVDPCPTKEVGNQTVNTQEQAELLRGVTKITGYLDIEGYITDWTPFHCLKEITGKFVILDDNLETITGFGNLTSVGGDFDINSNANLTKISGFGSLTSIGGYFGIYSNHKLTDASSLWKVVSVGGDFYCDDNTQLTNVAFDALVYNLKTIKGNINVNANSGADWTLPTVWNDESKLNWGATPVVRELNETAGAGTPGNFSVAAANELFTLPDKDGNPPP